MSDHQPQPGAGTLSAWAGEEKQSWWGATQVPVVHSVAFGYPDVDQWQAARPGRGPGAPQRHQIPRRPRRRIRGRRLRPETSGRADSSPPRNHRRGARPDGCLPVVAGDENPAPAHSPAKPERLADRPFPRSPATGQPRLLSRPGISSATRRGPAADAGFRRRAQLHCSRAASTPSAPSCRACVMLTSPPTPALSKPSSGRPPPPATSSAPRKNARPWASPRASSATRSVLRKPRT